MVRATQDGSQGRASRITFGKTKGNRVRSLQTGLTTFGLLALVLGHVDRTLQPPWLWIGYFLYVGIWLSSKLWYAEDLTLDFDRGIYTFEKGFLTGANVTGGRLTDIRHIYLYQVVDHDGKVGYVSQLAFLPELNREPLVFQGLHFPLTAAVFEKQMLHILETAARLNIPVHDESGWRGSWRTPATEPEMHIINPGEDHPSTLLPPPRKW